jgi:hypothetical protein
MINFNNEKFLLPLASFLGLAAIQSYSVYAAGYHKFPTVLEVVAISNFIVALVLTLPTLVTVIFFNVKIARFLSGITIIYVIYKLLVSHFFVGDFAILAKAGWVFGGILILLYALWRLSDEGWQRGARIISVAMIGWIASPLLIASIQSEKVVQPTLSVAKIMDNPPKAVVVLVLDEMSTNVAPMLYPVLNASGQQMHLGISKSAGKNTIYAIPSMLTPQRHDDVTACGATRLCGEVFFDMSQLRAAQPNTDVVGFYHPYCSIKGLRSCREAVPLPISPGRILGNLLSRVRFAVLSILPMQDDFVAKKTFERIRKSIAHEALNAPFWTRGGGLLYVHQFLPHPDGVGAELSLRAEYQEKIEDTVEFVNAINTKLKDNFGTQYALIVTTDHALRTNMWCNTVAFRKSGCLGDNPMDTDSIPFIVLTPKNTFVRIPSTNVGLLSPIP